MSKVYLIHPSVGIARVGNHETSAFLGQETPDGPALELDDNGKDIAFTTYKKEGLIRRKMARFRVFEYDEDGAGKLSNPREITASEAVVTWTVELANTKAAGPLFNVPQGNTPLRNAGVDRASLSITPGTRSISGRNIKSGVEFDTGKFKGQPVYLGELRTDADGRLLVLGGLGHSQSPSNRNLTNFANNEDWHDDTSDGPIQATITLPGVSSVKARNGAWVIVGPPDFAPQIQGIVTMYDQMREVAYRKGWLPKPVETKFRRDVYPVLLRAWQLRWTNSWSGWMDFPHDWPALAEPTGDPAPRKTAYDRLRQQPLDRLALPPEIDKHLKNWKMGTFTNDWNDAPVVLDKATPENLDRGATDNAVGGGFFPGIEMGVRMTEDTIYAAVGRFDQASLSAGDLTQRMAVPWQADFMECAGAWWPAQRPDNVLLDKDQPGKTAAIKDWADPVGDNPDPNINDMEDMVINFFRLGFVVPMKNASDDVVYVETERDPSLVRSSGIV